MNEQFEKHYVKLEYPDNILDYFYNLLTQDDPNNFIVLKTIAEGTQKNSPYTIAKLSQIIEVPRRVGVKDDGSNTIRYVVQTTTIDRKYVEKIVERLLYAGLIYLIEELPYKRIRLTRRGIQLLRYNQQLEKRENDTNE